MPNLIQNPLQAINPEVFHKLIQFFPFQGQIIDIDKIGSGHIHQTYRLKGPEDACILQAFNLKVFEKPDFVAQNLSDVESFLLKHADRLDGMEILRHRKAQNEAVFFEIDGILWRCFDESQNAIAIEQVIKPEQAFGAGRGFATFLAAIRDFPVSQMKITIPDFHNATKRWKKLDKLIYSAPQNRFLKAEKELDFLLERRGFMEDFYIKFEKGIFPLRPAHNDCKINNVLLNPETFVARCVIDLDTLMPGSWLFDFGDMLRTFLSHLPEDHPQPKEKKINMVFFKALVKGFVPPLAPYFSQSEKESLIEAGNYMCLLIGLRFLIDYLENDKYYPVNYSDHNLIRARNQFQMCLELENLHIELFEILKAEI
jgi:hypothetical protein